MKKLFVLTLPLMVFAMNAGAAVSETCNEALQSSLLQPSEISSGIRVNVDSIQTYAATTANRVLGQADGSGASIRYSFVNDRKQVQYSAFVQSLPAECK